MAGLRRRFQRERSDGGFTLIELLVVMAIISILASMLLPVYAKAREQARKAVCASNMKQMYMAIHMYCSDYDGLYPAQDMSNADSTYYNGGYVVPDWSSTNTPNWAQAIYSYLKSYDVYVCPSNKGWAPGSNTLVHPISYVMNGFAAGKGQDAAPSSSGYCLLFDYRFLNSGARVDPAPNAFWWYWGWSPHDDRFSVLYQDGHVHTIVEGAFGAQIWGLPAGNMFSY